MTVFLRSIAIASVLSLPLTGPTFAEPDAPLDLAQADSTEDFDEQMNELSDTARRTVEEFVNLIGPMMTRLSRLIDDLPVYQTPEILPNGDILIRRQPAPGLPLDESDDALTET